MSNYHWALKDIQQTITKTGVEIKVWTFQLCHLWFRWTHTHPQEHLTPRILRGVAIYSDKRFCFVNYHDNEQEEGGDTYVHTFTKEPWEYCETRWFYFHGRVDNLRSPSTSAIFKKHRTPPPSPFLFQHHIIGDTFGVGIKDRFWYAQSFKPSFTHKVVKVKLKLYRETLPGIFTVGIKATDAALLPTGEDLCTGISNGNTLTPDIPGEWREILLGDGANLTVDTLYAIVVRCPDAPLNHWVVWRIDQTAPLYDRGFLHESFNSGRTWDRREDLDFMFEEWGF